ncbi:glycosyl hydrolase family 28-related protein [Pseudomonas sp. nanlin1]|uniref:glycosyl hydrolase family 28-related protein n=1 Tax=Pseudomonas sp. nanlin1 TaxID=3040605 RepID=UPI00388FC015
MSSIFNVKDFGAVGDGITDDTLALQKTIDAAAAAGGGEVQLGNGTYIVSASSGAALNLKDNVSLSGNGVAQTTLKLADGTPAAVNALISADQAHNVGASGLTLDGNRENTQGSASGWVNGSATGVSLHDLQAQNFNGNGLDLTGQASEIELRNSSAHGNRLDGIVADRLVNSAFQDNSAYGNGGHGFNIGGDLELSDSKAYSNGKDGIFIQEGVGVPNKPSSLDVIGGQVYGNGGNGVSVEKAELFVINGLDISGNAGNGVYLNDGAYGDVSFNQIHNNNLGNSSGTAAAAEVYIVGDGNSATSFNTIGFNVITGGDNSTYGVAESRSGTDSNLINQNIISHTTQGNTAAYGVHSDTSKNPNVIFDMGTPGADLMRGDITRDELYGGAGRDTLFGGANDDLLVGGAGADRLSGGSGSDVFRFTEQTDSYRSETRSYADLITDFDTRTDRIDAASLGFSGLGNGHNGTLKAVYNAEKDITYLKNLDADAQGNRFELALAGNLVNSLSAANFQHLIKGTAAADSITGTVGDDTLLGGAGNDQLSGNSGDDRLDGGAGADTLIGGAGADTFVFSSIGDSLRKDVPGGTALRDTIVDFNEQSNDRIDVSALGFIGLGNGYDGTLKVVLNGQGDKTALKSLETDANGNHFEVLLQGNHLNDLSMANVVFANTEGATVVSSRPDQDRYVTGSTGDDNLHGQWGNDTLRGLAGNDVLDGGIGNDLLIGGAGSDKLTGGSGADTFRFGSVSDSFRSDSARATDLITDFTVGQDHLDVAALGFTGLGDGTDGTLKLSYNANLGRSYLRDLDGDADGKHFELVLDGDLRGQLKDDSFVWAAPEPVEPIALLGVPDPLTA